MWRHRYKQIGQLLLLSRRRVGWEKRWWKSWQSNKISTEKAARSPKFHHGDALASLASSGESDDGGLAPPPRKKQRTLEEATMQQAANGTVELNGVSSTSNGGGEPSGSGLQNGSGGSGGMTNGDSASNGNTSSPKLMDSTNHDIVRLIGQHLRTIGLKYVACTILLFLGSQFILVEIVTLPAKFQSRHNFWRNLGQRQWPFGHVGACD